VGLLCLSSVLFGVMAVLVRAGAQRGLPVGETLVLRFGVGLIGSWAVVRASPPSQGGRRDLLLQRGALGSVAVATYFYALFHLPAALAALLNCSSPVFAILWARASLGERPPWKTWVGLGAAGLGTALVVWGSAVGAGQATLWGLGVGLLSAVFSGVAVATIREARGFYSAGEVFMSFCAVGLLMAGPLTWATGWTWSADAVGVGLAAAGVSLAAQLLMTQALGSVETWVASALGQLTPVVAWLIGLGWAEQVSPVALAGAALTCSGVVVAARQYRR
jgi:drug/metabolite transporter (DMT)-like permease